jgi:hypothetical protein
MYVIHNTNAGFFSCFRSTVSTIKWLVDRNEQFFVDWKSGLYIDPDVGPNVWEYYFINPFLRRENSQPAPLKYMNRIPQARDAYIDMITRFVTLNHKTNQIINQQHKRINGPYIGVHIRQTDKFNAGPNWVEPTEGKPVDVSEYINMINAHEAYSGHKIWLATDSHPVVEQMVDEFGDRIVYKQDATRSIDNSSVHHEHTHISGYEKGLDAVVDCYMLAGGEFLFKGSSSLAVVAQLLNPSLECCNMNYIYNNDKRELWVEKQKLF